MGESTAQLRPRRVTLADVAQACNLSKAAVSQALNAKPPQVTLKPETREFIRQKSIELGYTASWAARSLAVRSTRQIGLLFRYAVPETRGIYGDIVQSLTLRLEQEGYHLLFVPLHGNGWAEILRGNRFDGCVVSDVDPAQSLAAIQEVGLPAVLVNNTVEDPAVSSIRPDDADGARQAVEHLLELGHRRIAYFGGSEQTNPHYSVRMRREAYAATMRRAGLGGHVLEVAGSMQNLFDRVPLGAEGYTAIVLYSHFEAVSILPQLHARNLRCPQDVSLVCFNDTFPMSELVPAFTTVAVPGAELGRVGAELMLELLGELPGREVRQVVLPQTLIVRQSTAPPTT